MRLRGVRLEDFVSNEGIKNSNYSFRNGHQTEHLHTYDSLCFDFSKSPVELNDLTEAQ